MEKSQGMSVSLLENKLLVQIPDYFHQMEAEVTERMFPYEDRPENIFGCQDGSKFCTFSFLDNQELTSAQVIYAIQTISKLVLSLYPSSLINEPAVLTLKDGNCGWFEYWSKMKEGKLHNIMFIFPVEGTMMLGTAGFPFQDIEGEQEIKAMLGSLELPEKKGRLLGVVR